MNSLPLYPISTSTTDCKILLGAGRWQSWKAAQGTRCRAVASALPGSTAVPRLSPLAGCASRGVGNGSSPAGPRPRVPPSRRDSLRL